MIPDRETLYAALFNQVSASLDNSLKTSSRRVKDWTQVEPSAQPALFMEQLSEHADYSARIPKWQLDVSLYLYVHDTSASGPVTPLNQLVTAIDNSLKNFSLPTDLGGQVARAGITQVETDGGALGDQGVAVITVAMVAAG